VGKKSLGADPIQLCWTGDRASSRALRAHGRLLCVGADRHMSRSALACCSCCGDKALKQKTDHDYAPVRVDDGWSDRSISEDADLDVNSLVEVRVLEVVSVSHLRVSGGRI
jgi:hypothetical protein